MFRRSWPAGALVALFAFVLACATRAEEAKDAEVGKAEDFKGKTFDLKEKGKASITLTFAAKKKAYLTVDSKKESDVNLFVYDEEKKVVAKDDSPGPSCKLTFAPKKAGKYTLEVVNLGPGDNSSTLKVSFKKKKAKPTGE